MSNEISSQILFVAVAFGRPSLTEEDDKRNNEILLLLLRYASRTNGTRVPFPPMYNNSIVLLLLTIYAGCPGRFARNEKNTSGVDSSRLAGGRWWTKKYPKNDRVEKNIEVGPYDFYRPTNGSYVRRETGRPLPIRFRLCSRVPFSYCVSFSGPMRLKNNSFPLPKKKKKNFSVYIS